MDKGNFKLALTTKKQEKENLPMRKLQNQLTKQPMLMPMAIVDWSKSSPPIMKGIGPKESIENFSPKKSYENH